MIYEECSVEVTGGYVLIAVKIPSDTCAICKTVRMRQVSAESVKQMIQGGHPIYPAFSVPWGGEDGWDFVYESTPTHKAMKRAIICGSCAKEISEAKKLGQRAVEEAIKKVANKIEHGE